MSRAGLVTDPVCVCGDHSQAPALGVQERAKMVDTYLNVSLPRVPQVLKKKKKKKRCLFMVWVFPDDWRRKWRISRQDSA